MPEGRLKFFTAGIALAVKDIDLNVGVVRFTRIGFPQIISGKPGILVPGERRAHWAESAACREAKIKA
jgi:hypothetical protein